MRETRGVTSALLFLVLVLSLVGGAESWGPWGNDGAWTVPLNSASATPGTLALGDTITVGTNTPFPPFEFRDGEGNLVGFTIDLVEEIGTRAGKTIIWIDYAVWEDLLEAGETGAVDMIASSMTITAERDVVYDFSSSYYSANLAALVHTSNTLTCPGRTCTATELSGLTWVVQTGTTSNDWVQDNLGQDCAAAGPLFCFADLPTVINTVKTGGADVAIMDLPAAVGFANEPSNELVAIGKIVTNDLYGMAVQEGDPLGILPLINPILQQLIDVGFIAQLERIWGVPSDLPPLTAVKNPDTIVTVRPFEVEHLDPARAFDSASLEVLDQVYEKLIFQDRESLLVFRPVLATNVPSQAGGTISAGGLEYRFTVRPGVKFHNGNDLTPEDVEYSFERNLISDFPGGPMYLLMQVAIGPGVFIFDPTDSSHRQRVQDFVRVEGDDVVFSLAFPFSPFLSLVSTFGAWIIDKETTIDAGGWPQLYDQATLQTYNGDLSLGMDDFAIGTGPYILEAWDPGVQVLLKKFPDYWNAAANLAAVSTVILKQVADADTRLSMLEDGTADFATILPDDKSQVIPLQQQGLVNIVEGLSEPVTVAAFINFDIDPGSPFGNMLPAGTLAPDGIPVDFFTDINVRRGLAYCTDYDTLISDTLSGDAQRSRGPIPNGLQGFDATSPVYTLDLVAAEAEFTAAWGGQLGTTGFTFEFPYNSGNPVRQAAAQMMSDCVNSLNPGIFQTSARDVPFGTLIDTLLQNQWTVGTLGWRADHADPHNFVQAFMDGRVGVFPSFFSYNNDAVNQLIDQGLAELNPTIRHQIYAEIQQAAFDDVPAVFLYQPTSFVVFRTWIHGWYYNPFLGASTDYFAYTKGTLPSAPQNLQATAGDGQVDLVWSPPADGGGLPTTSYKIYRGTVSGGETPLDEIEDLTGYTDTGLTNGQTYYYEVTAVNAVGEGPPSNEASATPVAPDTTEPTVSITSPADGSDLAFTSMTVSGTASDDVGVDKVELSTDAANWGLATGTASWSGTLTLVEGPNTIFARATDTSGNTATVSIAVTVDTVKPMAIAGEDQTVGVGAIVSFDASGSSDNVAIISFEWDFGDGTTGTGQTTTHIYTDPGAYTATLTVRDAAGNADTDLLTVTVVDMTAPTANAGEDQTAGVGATVSFDASGSSDNVAIVSFEWDFGDGTTGTGETTTHTYADPGTYTVTLTVRDAAGNADTTSIIVTVEAPQPSPPLATFAGIGVVAAAAAVAALLLWRRRAGRKRNE